MKDSRIRYVDRIRQELAGHWDRLIQPTPPAVSEKQNIDAPVEKNPSETSAEDRPAA